MLELLLLFYNEIVVVVSVEASTYWAPLVYPMLKSALLEEI